MLQLAHSSHASSLFSNHVLLARSTCTAVDEACTFLARLKPLLDLCAPGAHYLYRRLCSLCTFGTSRTFTRRVCFWRALLARTADDAACAIFKRLGPLLDPGSLAGTNCPAMLQLVQSPTPRAFTRPGFPGRHELPHRCYSLCSVRTPRTFTPPGFPGRHELPRRRYRLCSLRTS